MLRLWDVGCLCCLNAAACFPMYTSFGALFWRKSLRFLPKTNEEFEEIWNLEEGFSKREIKEVMSRRYRHIGPDLSSPLFIYFGHGFLA